MAETKEPGPASGHSQPFFLKRPSARSALIATLLCGALTAGGALFASTQSSLAVRSMLPLAEANVRELFLTTLPEDPSRVLLTSNRGKSSLRRGAAKQAGSRYWVHRYGDPARPGIPERILIKNRSRGAHLLIPVAAVDLARVLEALAPEPGPAPELRSESELVHVYWDRLFQGLFLEARFPKRELLPDGLWRQFDLVAVRDRFARTVDFTLHPNPRYYRARIAAGKPIEGPFRRIARRDGDELVFALYEDPTREPIPLYLPFSLFDELALAWGQEVPTILDDRWHVEDHPSYAMLPAPPQLRTFTARLVGMHLAASIEDGVEQLLLAQHAGQIADARGGR